MFLKKLISGVFFTVFLISSINISSASTLIELPHIYTMYENDFSEGAGSVPSAAADGYAADNEFLLFDGVLGQPLKTVKKGNETGVRIGSDMWILGKTFFFDFTKGGQKEGIRSGKVTLSFDFSIDGESTANETIMGINMTDAINGGRIAYFRNSSYEILNNTGDWGKPSNVCNIESGTVYEFKVVMDFDQGRADYYIDNEFIKTQTNWLGKTMDNFSIAMTGVIGYFDNLKFIIEYPKPVETIVTSDNTGNIFYEDEQVMMNVNVRNRHNSDVSEDITIIITDSKNNVVWSEELTVELAAEESKDFVIYPEIPCYGTYFLKADSDNGIGFITRLARSVKADEKNEKLGVCAHFDGRYQLDVSAMFDIISSAGFSAVRTDWGWRTNSDGTIYDFLNDGGIFEQTVKEANESQTDILALITIDNERVLQYNTDGGFNTSVEALAEYEKYLEELSGMLKGKIKYFEIGNENNYTTRPVTLEDIENGVAVIDVNKRAIVDNRGVFTYSGTNGNEIKWYDKDKVKITIKTEIEDKKPTSKLTATLDGVKIIDSVSAYVYDTGDNYYKILKAAYSGIKKGNPEAVVITSGSGVIYEDPNWQEYLNMREFAEGLLGMMLKKEDYCFDGYGVHPYHQRIAPEETDNYIQGNSWYMQAECTNTLFDKFNVPEDKQKWATEFGYSAYDDIDSSDDSEKKAAWLLRTVLANEIGGYHDKMFIYDILNDGLNPSDSEHNFGLVNYYQDKTWYDRLAYSAKPQYLALAQYNKIIAGAEFVKNEITDGTLYTAEFRKQEDRIFVLWDTKNNGNSVEFTGQGKSVKVYDMYGNLEDNKVNTDEIIIEVGENPIYVQITDMTTNIRFMENEAVATVVNDSNEEMMPVLISALYDDNDRLISASICRNYTVNGIEVNSVGINEIAEMKIKLNSGLKNKIMLFKDFNLAFPLCESIQK